MTLRRKAINFDEHFSQLIDMLNGIYSFSSKQQPIKGMTMYQYVFSLISVCVCLLLMYLQYRVVYDMCIAIPRPFTDKVFTGIAEYIDRHTLNECKVKKKKKTLFNSRKKPRLTLNR
jgi:hypothetical protein